MRHQTGFCRKRLATECTFVISRLTYWFTCTGLRAVILEPHVEKYTYYMSGLCRDNVTSVLCVVPKELYIHMNIVFSCSDSNT